MKAQHTKDELETLVSVTLDRTGINPLKTRIDKVIPDIILNDYAPKDVVEVALEHGFTAEICTSCSSVRVNGKWVPVEADLEKQASEQSSRFHSTCNRCYSQNYRLGSDNFY